MSEPAPKVSIVHEWLTEWGGSEDALRQILECYPSAQLFATIDYLKPTDRTKLGERPIRTTFLQNAPFVEKRFWNYLPITGLAVESHCTDDAQLILSSSHAFAKGVLTRADQLHVSYVYSPMRYAWDLHHEYLRDYGLEKGLKGLFARYLFHRLRMWDRQTANNVDLFFAISRHVQRRIWRTYSRPSRVIYPPVRTEFFKPSSQKDDFFITVSRLVSYKRIDLMLDAFRGMPTKKLIVIGDGPEMSSLKQRCPSNVTLMGRQPDAVVHQHLQSARAFIFAAHEDFGIAPVEAQACGTAVIAYERGGATETVRDLCSMPRPTGLLFPEQTAQSLRQAIEYFDTAGGKIDPHDCRRWAEGFSEARFRREFTECIDQAWTAWRRDPRCTEAMLADSGEPTSSDQQVRSSFA